MRQRRGIRAAEVDPDKPPLAGSRPSGDGIKRATQLGDTPPGVA